MTTDGPSVHIRPATSLDAETIAEIHMESIRTLGPMGYPPEIVAAWGRPRDGSRYRDSMASGLYFLAVSDTSPEEALGFSSLRREDGAWRIAVYVKGDAARRGIGTRLLKTAEEASRADGSGFIVLDASLVSVAFYASCGFTALESGTHRLSNGVDIPCVRMRKDLGGP